MLKNAFLYRVALHELKKQPFSAKQKFSIYRKLYELHSKPLSYAQKLFCTCLSSLSAKNPHFHKTKAVLLPKLFLIPTQNNSFPPSISHSHHPLPTVCKEYSRSFAVRLTPYSVKPERRTDSNHCRRYPTKLQLFAKPVT